jgi:hypothetical protein
MRALGVLGQIAKLGRLECGLAFRAFVASPAVQAIDRGDAGKRKFERIRAA